MHRIEGANNIKDSAGRLQFTDGPPATTVPAAWLNSVQEEIANVIELAGLNLNAAGNDTRTQLYEAFISIMSDIVTEASLGEFLEITTNTDASKNKNYITNHASNKLVITLPSDLTQGSFNGIYGKGAAGWIINGDYIFYGYKKLLYSNLYNDSIRLIAISSTELKIDYRFTQKPEQEFYGFFGGGQDIGANDLDFIDHIDMTVLSGNAGDKSDLTVARRALGGITGIQYGFFGGGLLFGATQNVIDYIDVTTLSGNAIDRGDLSVARYLLTGVSGIQYGFYCGGTGGANNVIDYIDVSVTSVINAIDRGDLSVARNSVGGTYGFQYGFLAGGGGFDTIDYIDITLLTGDATDRGDITVARNYLAGVSGIQYGFFGGGSGPSNVIEYIDNTLTTGNATDRGDLTVARGQLAGVSGIQYGFFGGGSTGAVSNVIDYIDMSLLTGNATDRGDLQGTKLELAGL